MANVNTGTNWTCYDSSTMTAREIYGRTLAEMAKDDKRIVALTADLEKSTALNKFGAVHPDRLFNVGIAEQDMLGAAAGMAKVGLIPFASSFAIMASLRGGEQIRTDICYQNLPVKIISTHSGISFGHAGTTHHCTEDFAIMRSFANMTVICPADGIETSRAVRACVDIDGPVYIRIGRGFEPPVYEDENYDFEIGKANVMKEGKDLTIITCGIGVLQSINAAKTLSDRDGIDVEVINMHTIKPIDREAIIKTANKTGKIITIEEHNVEGGLGDAVASVLAEENISCKFKKHGIMDMYAMIGYAEDLYSYYKLDSNGIVDVVRDFLGKPTVEDNDWEDE